MSTTLIWTPRGHVEPEAALAAFIDRTGCMAQELLVILEELWQKASALARRASVYVLNTETHCYPADVVRRAQQILKKAAQNKPRKLGEMTTHLQECLLEIAASDEKSSEARITFKETALTADMQALMTSPYITFPGKSVQAALIAATMKKNWNFVDNEVTVTVNIPDAYNAFMLTDALVKVASDFELT